MAPPLTRNKHTLMVVRRRSRARLLEYAMPECDVFYIGEPRLIGKWQRIMVFSEYGLAAEREDGPLHLWFARLRGHVAADGEYLVFAD